MSTTILRKKIISKHLIIAVMKSVLHIAIYILIGLALAFFINGTAQAAELEHTNYSVGTARLSTPTVLPPPALGRLLITSRAHGTGALLQGTVFEVRRIIDDVFMAQIATNQFGEASVNLPIGDYFLRELVAPSGFIANPNRVSVRITADSLTEINITHQPIPQEVEMEEEAPALDYPAYGRLLITNKAQAGAPLANTTFEVRSIMDDRLVAQLQTNQFGEAAVDLPPGDYFVRQIVPPAGFILDSSRTNVRIVSGELLSILVISTAEPIEYETVIEEYTPAYGRLLVTLMSGANGERLPHGRITVHDIMTDAHIITLSSNNFGEASMFLPAGRYFMRQASMPRGYLPNFDRIPFTMSARDITDMSLVIRAEPVPEPPPPPPPAPEPALVPPAAPAATQTQPVAAPAPSAVIPPAAIEIIPDDEPDMQSRIEIVTRAAGSGNPLSGGLFAIYRAYDSRRMGELTTSAGGTGYLAIEPGLYFVRELCPTFGFLLEPERIFLEVGEGETVIVELTKLRDSDIPYLPPDENGSGFIYITQTGQLISMLHYVGGGLMLVVALVSVSLILCEILFKKKRRILYA